MDGTCLRNAVPPLQRNMYFLQKIIRLCRKSLDYMVKARGSKKSQYTQSAYQLDRVELLGELEDEVPVHVYPYNSLHDIEDEDDIPLDIVRLAVLALKNSTLAPQHEPQAIILHLSRSGTRHGGSANIQNIGILPTGFRRSARVGSLSAAYYEESEAEDDKFWEKEQQVEPPTGSEPEERNTGWANTNLQLSVLKHAARSRGGKSSPENVL